MESTVHAEQGTGFERAEIQSVVIEDLLRHRVSSEKDLEPPVQLESVDYVGPNPAARFVRCLENERFESRTNQLASADQARQSGACDQYVCIALGHCFGYQPCDVGPPLNGPVRSLVIQPP